MGDKQIAEKLHISQETVRYHKKNLYRLLDAVNMAQALAAVLRTGMLSLEDL